MNNNECSTLFRNVRPKVHLVLSPSIYETHRNSGTFARDYEIIIQYFCIKLHNIFKIYFSESNYY